MNEFPISILDAIFIGVLIISGIIAFARGFVREVFAVAGWVGAIFATIYGFDYAKPYAREYISPLIIADLVTGAVIFIATLVVLSWLSHLISSRVRESAISALDRSLGFLFGLARGAVLICIAWLLLIQLMPPKDHPRWIKEARLLPAVAYGGSLLAAALPRKVREEAISAGEWVRKRGGAMRENYDALPNSLKTPPTLGDKESRAVPEKGYDAQSRKQLENLTRNTREQE